MWVSATTKTLALWIGVSAVHAAITPANFSLALQALPTLGQAAISANSSVGVPGLAIAVVWNNALQYAAGFGFLSIDGNENVTTETVFQLASLSKPLASTTVAAIVSEGNITFDSPVNSPALIAAYSDPWISAEVSIADGLSHRSGLYPLAGDDLEQFGFNRSKILPKLQYMKPGGAFRSSYGYSNYGFTLAAQSAATSASKSWEDAAQDYLYGPLNMSSTSSHYSDFVTRSSRAVLHTPGANGSWATSPPRNPDPQAPAGGATSNVVDLAKWMLLHLNSGSYNGTQLISQAAINETRLPHSMSGPNPITGLPSFYGLGWDSATQDGSIVVSHAGAFSQGTRSYAKLNINEGLGVVVLSNCFPTGEPEGIAQTFFDLAMYGKSTADWVAIWNGLYQKLAQSFELTSPYTGTPPADATAALPLSAYAGKYTNDYVGLINFIVGASGDMNLTFPGSSNDSLQVVHWDRDNFYINLESPAGVLFTIGADGNASSVTIDAFNTNGGGMFTRLVS
jgi:CubicO group peptidase (beta-lactamase class C family)